MPGLRPAVPDKWTLLEGLKPSAVIFLHLFLQPCLPLLPPALSLRAPVPSPALLLHIPELILVPAFPDPDAGPEVLQLPEGAEGQGFIPSFVGSQVSIHQPVPRLALSAQPHPGAPPPCHPPWAALAQPEQSKALPSPTG